MERSPDDDAARVYAYTLLLPHQGPPDSATTPGQPDPTSGDADLWKSYAIVAADASEKSS